MERVTVTRKARIGRPPKLTDAQVNELVVKYNNGAKSKDLAREYNIGYSTVNALIARRRGF